jgi:hypothetical protein
MRRTSGYALAIVLGVLTLLGLSLLLLSQVLSAAVEETKRSYAEQRATYACDSAARVAGADAEAVMSADSEATSATAMAALCSDLGPCLGDLEDADCTSSCDYRINTGTGAGPRRIFAADVVAERFSLRVASGTGSSSIRTGAFRSLLALRQRLSLSVAARHDASGALCRANNSFTVVQLSPAQLMLTSMVPVDWLPRGVRNPSGDLRLVGPSAYVDGATRLESANLTRVVSTGAITGGALAWSGAGTIFESLATAGRAATIPAAEALKLPTAPASNIGREARWLLDPVYADDDVAVANLKFAMSSDIRIIDGIWFIKPPPNDRTIPQWPGIMIWSDHPGSGVRPSAELERIIGSGVNIGQEDRSDIIATPKRYSYYPYVNTGIEIQNLSRNRIVSYGAMRLHGDNTTRSPGAFSRLCVDVPGQPAGSLVSFARCGPTPQTAAATALVDASRSGFIDLDGGAGANDGENMLPLNFDVAAFIRAMRENRPGELGSFFCGTRPGGNPNDQSDRPTRGCRHFNGQVWIGSSWPGRPTSTASPQLALTPTQGDGAAVGAMPPVANRVAPLNVTQNSLYAAPLCGENATFTHLDSKRYFPVVACTDPVWSTGVGAINAVRIFNARDLRSFINSFRTGAKGFTIATHLPLYVVGDVNTEPVPAARNKSVLLAGDRVTFMTTTFDDAEHRWGNRVPIAALTPGPAMAIRASIATTVPPGGTAEDALRFLEPITTSNSGPGSGSRRIPQLDGSLWILGAPAHHSGAMANGRTRAVPLSWSFDPFLIEPNAAPPGMPLMTLGVQDRWFDAR